MNRAELKSLAKSQIKGNIGILFVIALIIAALSVVCSYIPLVGSLASSVVLTPAFSFATVAIYLGLTEGKKPAVADAFNGFKYFWISFKTTFLVGLFTCLWSLLFVIPGIIKALSYSQAMYIVAENPEIDALEAINRSKRIMDGHKMELFVLELSFLGWALLGTLTLGILYIWLVPYMNATMANFYNRIKPVEVEAAPIVEEAPVVEIAE